MLKIITWDEEKNKVGETVDIPYADGFGISTNGDLVITQAIGSVAMPGQPQIGKNICAVAAGHWVRADAIDNTVQAVPPGVTVGPGFPGQPQ